MRSLRSESAPRMPRAAPAMASGMVSTKDCRTSRARVAPRAARTANSAWRPVARASSRLARLTQPTKKSVPTAASSSQSAGRTDSVTWPSSGSTATRTF
jgi:hypothetical protein